MNTIPSSQELAREALEILKRFPMTSEEHFEFLVEKGIIDRSGRVICAKLFGDAANQPAPATAKDKGQ